MHHRHLLPNEIDQLLDSEVGFGVAPLRNHIDECTDCRSRVDDARRIVEALDRIPRFAPAPSFANRVMAEVQVIEPWHVALTTAAMRLVPRSTSMRVVFAASASVVAVAVSSAAVWLAFRGDVAMYIGGLAGERVREALTSAARSLIGSVLGSGAVDAIGTSGAAAIAVGAGVVLLAAGSAALGLRALALASRRSLE